VKLPRHKTALDAESPTECFKTTPKAYLLN